MRIAIVGFDPPGSSCDPGGDQPGGYRDVHVAVEPRGGRGELLGLTPGDAGGAAWELQVVAAAAPDGTVDVKGPYIQGPPGGRFIYLSWGAVDGAGSFARFRRAKLMLDAVPPVVLRDAADQGVLVGRLALTDASGLPVCAAVRPPAIDWSAAAG